MKFLDLFAGIGGFRLGMEMAGHECVGWCEIDKYARKSYVSMHNPKGDEWFAEDIRKVQPDEIPAADVWCFGFPCQDISIAGKQQGLTGERSGLFYTVIDLIKNKKEEDKPSVLFIENVKNLLSINDGWDFAKVLFELDEAGYDAEWQIIDSAWFVPQHRERIFIIGHLRGRSTRKVLPITGSNSKTVKQIGNIVNTGHWDNPQRGRIYSPEGISPALNTMQGGGLHPKILINKQVNTEEAKNRTILIKKLDVRACLTPDRLNKRQNGRQFKEPGEPMFTLTSQDKHGIEIGGRIRRLTPKECFRLQGFPDEYFEKAQKVNSDTQLYKQAGNSVTVSVIYEIAKRL